MTTFSPEPVGAIDAQSPLATDAFGGVLDALGAAGALMALPAILGAAVSLVVRWRRAGQVERAQLKWLVAVASVAAVALSASIIVSGGPVGDALFAVFLAACLALPFAIGIAVLRYRLYEIDHIISRTIGYAVVTGILGAAFVGTILVAGSGARIVHAEPDHRGRRVHPRRLRPVPARSRSCPSGRRSPVRPGPGGR